MRFIIIFLSILLIGCSEKETRFIPSQEMKSVYNQEELADIQTLVELFNSRVCEDPNDLSCYRGVLRDIDGDMSLLFEMFDKDVSDKVGDFISKHPNVIWSECRSTLYAVNKEYQSPCLGPDSKLAVFLGNMPKGVTIFKNMEKNLQETGALQINFFLTDYYILTEFDNNELKDPNINFLIAIAILGDYYEYQLQLVLGVDMFDTSGLKLYIK